MRVDTLPLLPLQGRDPELAVLDRALSELPHRGAALLIRGEPGLGKSRLVEETLRRATEFGYATAVGSSSELEQQRPLAALIDAFSGIDPAPRTKHLISLLLGAGDKSARSARFDLSYQIIEECLAYLESRLAEGPFVLVIEDLHWADSSTHLFFRHAAARLTTQPLLLLGTRRPWPRVPELDRIEEMSNVTSVVAGPLSEEEIVALAERVLGFRPEGDLLERLRATSGNPLFAQEVLIASTKDDLWQDFARSIVRRLTYLSPPCLELLRVASIASAPHADGAT